MKVARILITFAFVMCMFFGPRLLVKEGLMRNKDAIGDWVGQWVGYEDDDNPYSDPEGYYKRLNEKLREGGPTSDSKFKPPEFNVPQINVKVPQINVSTNPYGN